MFPLWFTRLKLVVVSCRAPEQVWDDNSLCPPRRERRAHVEAVTDILQTNLIQRAALP